MADSGIKFDHGKLRYDLVPPGALASVTEVLAYGAAKYEEENWRFVGDPEARYFAAAMRHLMAWQQGEAIDPESGCEHLAHAACCLMFLIERDGE